MKRKPEVPVLEIPGINLDELRVAAAPWLQLPETGFLRLCQIIGDPKAKPPIPPLIPVSKSSWWLGVKNGRYPQPVKLGPRMTAWAVDSIRALIAAMTAGELVQETVAPPAWPNRVSAPVHPTAAHTRNAAHSRPHR